MQSFGPSLHPIDRTLLTWIAFGMVASVAIAVLGLEDRPDIPLFLQPSMVAVRSIERWAQLSSHPQHTAIFFASMWSLAPGLFYVMCLQRDSYFPRSKWREERAIQTTMAAVVLTVAFFAFAVVGFGSDSDFITSPSRRSFRGLVLESRLGSGFFGSLIIFFTCYCIVGAGTFLHRIIKGKHR